MIEAIYAERKTINNAFRIFVTVRMFVSDERDLLLEKLNKLAAVSRELKKLSVVLSLFLCIFKNFHVLEIALVSPSGSLLKVAFICR